MNGTSATPRSEPWPSWAKAMFAAVLLLTVAVLLPWILMWSGCMAAMGGLDGMREMMDGSRPMMR